jgi:hypothetical protein
MNKKKRMVGIHEGEFKSWFIHERQPLELYGLDKNKEKHVSGRIVVAPVYI